MRVLTGDPASLDATQTAAGPGAWSGVSRTSKRLVAAGGVMLLMMLIAVGFTMWDTHQATSADIRQNVSKLGIAISEQTTRSFQSVDLALQDMSSLIAAKGADTSEHFTQVLRTEAMHTELSLRDQALPQASAFSIVDAHGQIVNSSRQWPPPPLDVSDRGYFRHFRDINDHNLLITPPMQSRAQGEWTGFAVRRLNDRDGHFLGLVIGAIDLGYFRDFYKALTLGADTTVTLLRRDGTILTSYPATAPIGTALPLDQAWHDLVDRHTPGTFVTDGKWASDRRIVAATPLVDYALVVNVSVSQWEALANWRKSALLVALGTVCATICMTLLLRAVTLQLQGLERSEASLAKQNVWLETTRYRMESQAAELQSSRAHLAEKSAALETTLHHMNQGIMMIGADRRVAVYNTRVQQMLDLPESLLNTTPSFDDVVAHQHRIQEFVETEANSRIGRAEVLGQPHTYERKRPDGRILEIQSIPLASGGMVRTYTDITERRLSEEQVRYFAHHDDLTRLVNRVVFQERLAHAIELAIRTQRSIAVMYLDLDGFKKINDTLGHAAGDKLLVQVAERLRTTVRDIDTVARMGGDEFAVIQPLIEQPDSTASLARRLLAAIHLPYDIDGIQCRVGMSIGIAMYPDHASNAIDLLRHTDTALYRAKADGRGVFRVFDEQMDTSHQQASYREIELRQALEHNQFELDYQPIIDIRTGATICREALLRWRHPERGLVSPGEFIGLAETTRLIVPIGLWVLQTACTEAVGWPESISLSVNLSPVQFTQHDLIERLTAIQEETGFPLSRLVLEVTEGLLLEETGVVMSTMTHLRDLGVTFSLDDFGTAYAGLSYIRHFPFNIIKIDKSFVQDTVRDPAARAIVDGILGIATALNLDVIAEGVETQAQLDQIKAMNGTYVQGYLTGRPGRPES